MEEQLQAIFNYASDNNLEDVEIRIGRTETEDIEVTLWVKGKDRIGGCNSLLQLEASMKEHDNLDWMKS